MEDLTKLNRTIAEHWLGRLSTDQEEYLRYTSVCLGEFHHSAAEIAAFLAHTKHGNYDPLRNAKLNRRYLNFARLASKDIGAGHVEMLIKLGITLEQAEMFAKLTNGEVSRLAFVWDGAIIRFASQVLTRGSALHARAAKHHATAYVTTNSSIKKQ
jgi:hypothetical protein